MWVFLAGRKSRSQDIPNLECPVEKKNSWEKNIGIHRLCNHPSSFRQSDGNLFEFVSCMKRFWLDQIFPKVTTSSSLSRQLLHANLIHETIEKILASGIHCPKAIFTHRSVLWPSRASQGYQHTSFQCSKLFVHIMGLYCRDG